MDSPTVPQVLAYIAELIKASPDDTKIATFVAVVRADFELRQPEIGDCIHGCEGKRVARYTDNPALFICFGCALSDEYSSHDFDDDVLEKLENVWLLEVDHE